MLIKVAPAPAFVESYVSLLQRVSASLAGPIHRVIWPAQA
jgi:hypothetical protein